MNDFRMREFATDVLRIGQQSGDTIYTKVSIKNNKTTITKKLLIRYSWINGVDRPARPVASGMHKSKFPIYFRCMTVEKTENKKASYSFSDETMERLFPHEVADAARRMEEFYNAGNVAY